MPADSKATLLQFNGYDAATLRFDTRKVEQSPGDGETVDYAPRFKRKISKQDDHHYIISLAVTVGLENDRLPFTATVELDGHFTLEGDETAMPLLKTNATAILFPYLRATMSQLTTLANISPILIPTFNIVEMFKESEAQEKSEENLTE